MVDTVISTMDEKKSGKEKDDVTSNEIELLLSKEGVDVTICELKKIVNNNNNNNNNNGEEEETWMIQETCQDSSLIPTIGVFLWIGGMCSLTISFLYFIFLASSFQRTILVILYVSSLALPTTFPGKRIPTILGNFMMKNAERYFGLKTTLEDPKSIVDIGHKGNSGILFAMEPHDLLPYSAFTFSRFLHRIPGPAGVDVKCLMTSAIFRLPFIRQIYTYVGGESVGKENFRKLLQNKQSCVMIPGGVQEVLYSMEKEDTVLCYLTKRKGFIRLALETGTPIIPTFTFHLDGSYTFWTPKENKLFSSISRFIGFAPIIFFGRWYLPIGIPNPQKLHVVIGKPIHIPCEGRNSVKPESIEKYHQMYIQELEALYLRHRKEEGYGHRSLKII